MLNTIFKLALFIFILFIFTVCIISCMSSEVNNKYLENSEMLDSTNHDQKTLVNYNEFGVKCRALLSTRFEDLSQLKTLVSIQYDKDYTTMDSADCRYTVVTLSYLSNGESLIRTMTSGIAQNDISNLQTAGYLKRAEFVLINPNIIQQRRALEKAYILARRKPAIFGPGDMSFFDLAEASFRHINTPELAYQNSRDSSEKGYINTFNHITAQAIITSFFSESLADLISDLHERQNMKEITSGRFNERQLKDTFNSPEDNYVDIINNEIGQKIGLTLKKKYNLSENSVCTPILLASYLNDIQSYYMWSLEIGLDNFRPSDEVVVKFSNKINVLLKSGWIPTDLAF